MVIFIFKTSVSTKGDIERLKLSSREILKEAKWTFDLEDCDKVLRIDSPTDIRYAVIMLLRDSGFGCEELD